MKILIATSDLRSFGGAQSHTLSLHAELDRQGHDVTLREARAIEPGGDYDAALLTHNTTTARFLDLYPGFPRDKIVQTVHGLWAAIEKPMFRGIKHVAISEEIRDAYPAFDMRVILNGVDLEVFKPTRQLPEKPRTLLSMSQSERFNAMLREICEERGIEFRSRNKNVNPVPDIYREMQEADICVAIGRSAYEAMACGCFVSLADMRPYQDAQFEGYVTIGDYHEILRCNCSGRHYGMKIPEWYDPTSLYSPVNWSRRLAERYHDIRDKAAQYLELIA